MRMLFQLACCSLLLCASGAELAALKQNRHNAPELPDNLIVGYASWGECDEKIVTAVQDGVNVLIWFAINLSVNPGTGEPIVTGGPDLTCVKDIKTRLVEMNLPTVHLISIGGWNSPHPETSNSAENIYMSWVQWNDGLFDGFDWDIEGKLCLLCACQRFIV